MDHQALAQLLGNYGEFFGSIAVLATLGYLIVQIRQNTRSTNSNNNHNVMMAFNSFNETLFASPDLARIYYEGLVSPDRLGSHERHQFVHMIACLLNIYRNLYYQFVEGTFPEQQWLVQAREAKQLITTPGGAHALSITASYNVLVEYLQGLPSDDAGPLSQDLFPSSTSE